MLPALAVNTWQFDRKCWAISASFFDKMGAYSPPTPLCKLRPCPSYNKLCGGMKAQADDIISDLAPRGPRQIVIDPLAANVGPSITSGSKLL